MRKNNKLPRSALLMGSLSTDKYRAMFLKISWSGKRLGLSEMKGKSISKKMGSLWQNRNSSIIKCLDWRTFHLKKTTLSEHSRKMRFCLREITRRRTFHSNLKLMSDACGWLGMRSKTKNSWDLKSYGHLWRITQSWVPIQSYRNLRNKSNTWWK